MWGLCSTEECSGIKKKADGKLNGGRKISLKTQIKALESFFGIWIAIYTVHKCIALLKEINNYVEIWNPYKNKQIPIKIEKKEIIRK